MTFKVGDIVIIKESCSGLNKGDKAYLVEYEDKFCAVKDGLNKIIDGCTCVDNWELVVEDFGTEY